MHWSLQPRFRTCNLFCCNGVIFLHSGWCDAMFWICNLNSADNTLVVLFLQSSVYTVSRPLLLFPPAQQQGGARGAGRGHSWDTPPDGRRILFHMASCWASTAGGKEEERGTFGVVAEALLSWKWPNICQPRKQGIIPYFALLAHSALPHLLTCLIWTTSFLSVAPPHCRGEMRKSVGFICLSELTYNKTKTTAVFFLYWFL